MTAALSLPPAVSLLAATSRLIDLHQSRREDSGAYSPIVPDSAGRNLGIALLILEILRELEMQRGFGFVTVEELHLLINEQVVDVLREELDFVIELIAHEREIRFAVPNKDRQFEYRSTRQTTNLVLFADSHAQIKMTDNGRLFLRICDEERSWLYNDADTSKLLTALRYGKFYDLPPLCRSISLELASKSAMLTDLIELPTRKEQCDTLIADGKGIGEMLQNAKETVQEAMKIAFDVRTYDLFEDWREKEKAEIGLGNIQAELEVLLKIIESVSRRFIDFLSVAQQRRDVEITSYKFLEIADHLVAACDPQSADQLEKFMASIIFPHFSIQWFHPSILPGEIDFYELMDRANGNEPMPNIFNFANKKDVVIKRFYAFVERNREKLYARLASGPLPFSELLVSMDFELQPGESPLDFIGIYTTPEAVDGAGAWGAKLIVGFTGSEATQHVDNSLVIASDPLIFIGE